MKKELCIKQIYDDFLNKVSLSEMEKQVLDLYISNVSIVKMADITSQGTSTISRIIAEVKCKYNIYKKLEISRLEILKNK
jgi:hypothetical protein